MLNNHVQRLSALLNVLTHFMLSINKAPPVAVTFYPLKHDSIISQTHEHESNQFPFNEFKPAMEICIHIGKRGGESDQ